MGRQRERHAQLPSSLEFGCWLDDPELLRQAKEFVSRVLRHSEDLDPDSDVMESELVGPEFDEQAMAEAAFLEGPDEEPDWPWAAHRVYADRSGYRTQRSRYPQMAARVSSQRVTAVSARICARKKPRAHRV